MRRVAGRRERDALVCGVPGRRRHSMLEHLDIHGGEQVLEIGTGTGWNTALLAHRLEPEQVTTIEVDPEVAAHARTALKDIGYGAVTVITGDGAQGYPPGAPYDRVLVTVGCKDVPYAWVAQTRPGGRIVAPSWALTYHGLLLALTVDEDGAAAGHVVDEVSFMMLRDQRPHRARQPITDDYEQATITDTDLHPAEVANAGHSPGAVIAIGTQVPECRSDYFPSSDPDSQDGHPATGRSSFRIMGTVALQPRCWTPLHRAPVRYPSTVG